jgi:glycosyltransferase involved in cell wall biosynthesis
MAQLVEAFYVAAIRRPVPLVGIDMRSDPVQRVLPKSPVTTYGTPEFVAHAVAMGRRRARLLVPPVDTRLNAPGITNTGALRARYGLDADELTLVAVSRLCPDMDKADGLARVIRAVQALAGELRLRFVIVGDGESRPALEQQAAAVNAALGRLAIVLTGEMLDPRAAYELADVVVGMGGSALRGMAFAKPVIVLGGAGFAELVTPQTASSFQYKGIYGIGDGAWENANLVQHLRSLAISPTLRRHLGEFSRSFVAEHFSLERVSDDLNRYCHEAVANPLALSSRIIDVVRTAAVLKGGHLVPSAVRNYIKRHESARASVIQEHELARARGSVGRVHRA